MDGRIGNTFNHTDPYVYSFRFIGAWCSALSLHVYGRIYVFILIVYAFDEINYIR